MKLLLDTHAALWWWEGSSELSKRITDQLTDPSTSVFFSAISGYEIFQKVRLGKLDLPEPLLRDLPGEVLREGWELLPLGLADSVRAARIDHAHCDPFDRILAAQSEIHGLTLATTDGFFADAGFRTLW
jgi:PIN domain nuclease of toxin-antitoxin system